MTDLIARARRESAEVLYAEGPVAAVANTDIAVLKTMAQANRRRRIRLCTHAGPQDGVHEMLILHEQGAYVRPHKHLGKNESFHVIEGSATVVLFDEDGGIAKRFAIGEAASGASFYCRIRPGVFHAFMITSEWLVFHETTSGPFDRAQTIWAPWSPPEEDEASVAAYLGRLAEEGSEEGSAS